eukprot:6243289-Alexandrium_andersonii.AAC.1
MVGDSPSTELEHTSIKRHSPQRNNQYEHGSEGMPSSGSCNKLRSAACLEISGAFRRRQQTTP